MILSRNQGFAYQNYLCFCTSAGQPRVSWTMLDSTVSAGDDEITLQRAVDWQVGDMIVIASTGKRHSQRENEQRQISAVRMVLYLDLFMNQDPKCYKLSTVFQCAKFLASHPVTTALCLHLWAIMTCHIKKQAVLLVESHIGVFNLSN